MSTTKAAEAGIRVLASGPETGTKSDWKEPGDVVTTDRYGTALVSWDAMAEARLRLKIDLLVVPLPCLMFLFCKIDGSNIGNARIAGLEKEMKMGGNDYNLVNTIFYLGYIIFEFPSTLAGKMVGPAWWLPLLTLCFGATSIATAHVHSFGQLAGVRFLLGVFEAGVMPVITVYFSRWYRRSELVFRLSMYVVAAPLGGAFGGLLASGILKVSGFAGLPAGSFRLIFVIEGIITIAISAASFVLLTTGPETARWLSASERQLAVARIKSERVAVTEVVDKTALHRLRSGLWNPVVLATAFAFLLETVTTNGLAFFAPTIVRSIYPQATGVRQQLYTVPPYLVATVCTLALCFASWRLDRRHIFIILSAPVVMVGYAIFVSTTDTSARYTATFLIASTIYAPAALTHAQVSANVVSDSARSMAIGTNMFFAMIGSMIATWSYVSWDGPYYHIGNGLNLATSTTMLVVASLTLLWMRADNRRRERVDVDTALAGLSAEQIRDLDWRHPAFRWQY